MSASFVERLITVSFSYATGPDANPGPPDVYTYSGLRVSATIVEQGATAPPSANITIYGMSLSDMNKLSSLGLSASRYRNNTVQVSAGDVVDGMATVFEGSIYDAFGSFAAAPDAAFQVVSLTGYIDQLKPIAPTSYQGSVDVGIILKTLANQIGYGFINGGVQCVLSNPYLHGTAIDQIQAVCDAAGINYSISKRVLSIWPEFTAITAPVPRIAPDSGLIGYPEFASNGLSLKTIYNPQVFCGGKIQVDSSLPVARGEWLVLAMSHTLEAKTPNGDWSTDLWAVPLSFDPGILSGS